VHFLTVYVRDHDDGHSSFNCAHYLLLFFVVRLFNVMRSHEKFYILYFCNLFVKIWNFYILT
jgi:hypothetical protein